jgi:uncharacterized protein
VKLYADEAGHHVVRTLHPLVIFCLARVEVPAAFWRKHRGGELEADHANVLTAEFEADYHGDGTEEARFVIVGVPASILDDAARLVARHGIRADDAVQLASAIAAREADPGCAGFACFDQPLRRAATAEAFYLLP